MGLPFQRDILAQARLDFCEAPRTRTASSCTGLGGQLACELRARQCAAFLGSVGRSDAAPKSLLLPAEIESWKATPSCAEVKQRGGACHLLSNERWGDSLWRSLGERRENEARAGIEAAESLETLLRNPTPWGRRWLQRELDSSIGKHR